MKYLILIFGLLLTTPLMSQQDTIQVENPVKCQGWIKIGEKKYPVYKGSRGGLYIDRVSKTGNPYRDYLDEKQKAKIESR